MQIDFIFHLGARTDTTEFDYSILEKLNVEYSKKIWNLCVEKNIPLVYASSAATYGDGELGYKDDHALNAAEWIVYDALYAYCQQMVRAGKPEGMFAT